MRKRMGKKLVSIILTISILLTCIPTMTLMAEEVPAPDASVAQDSGYEPHMPTDEPVSTVAYDAYNSAQAALPTPIADAYVPYDPDAEPPAPTVTYEPTPQPEGPYDEVIDGDVTILL